MPAHDHNIGAKVTAPGHGFMGVITDTHTSHRVARDGVELLVGDSELHADDEKLETYTSYLVRRNWDGVDCWVSADQVEAGHLVAHEQIRAAAERRSRG